MSTTYGGWSEIWQIMTRHAKPTRGAPDVTNPPDIFAFTGAGHDVFFFPATGEEIPEDSEDGQRLIALGCHIEDGSWVIYT